MIISGGENIYPAEIERVLAEHPSVGDCAVIGVPDEQWGEVPKAVVVAAPGQTLDTDALLAHCRANLAGFKCPKSVDVWPSCPATPRQGAEEGSPRACTGRPRPSNGSCLILKLD